MRDKLKIAIIIPCFNEQDNVVSLFHEINSISIPNDYVLFPIFINDCSTDQTKEILKTNQIPHLNLAVNLGIGGAVQTGFKYAKKNNFDIAIQMDGDGQHPPSELFKIIEPLIHNQADVVIGSRYLTKEGFQSTRLRRTGINYFKWLNKKLSGLTIHDSTSGYRAYNKKALEVVCNYYPDEYPEPEAIILFALHKLMVKEVPVTMRERQGGVSSIKTYKTIYYMFKVTLGIIFLYIRLKFNGKRHTI
jgi:glycosyltransferase involved in cell wall biosynthesis